MANRCPLLRALSCLATVVADDTLRVKRQALCRLTVLACINLCVDLARASNKMISCLQVLASGTCGCLDYDLSQGDDWRTIYDNMAFVDDYIGDYDDDIKRQVVAALCTGTVNDGDHLQVRSLYRRSRLTLMSVAFRHLSIY